MNVVFFHGRNIVSYSQNSGRGARGSELLLLLGPSAGDLRFVSDGPTTGLWMADLQSEKLVGGWEHFFAFFYVFPYLGKTHPN